MSSLQIATNTFILLHVTLTTVRKAFRTVKHYALTEFVLRLFSCLFYDHNLEKSLTERGYSEKLNRKEILKARSQSRETILYKEKMSRNDDRVTFNIRYYPVLKNIRTILEELYIFLASDEQHKVFTDIPRMGFKKGKSLKDVAGNSGPCGGKRPPCQLCKVMK